MAGSEKTNAAYNGFESGEDVCHDVGNVGLEIPAECQGGITESKSKGFGLLLHGQPNVFLRKLCDEPTERQSLRGGE